VAAPEGLGYVEWSQLSTRHPDPGGNRPKMGRSVDVSISALENEPV
jgi:hypothetical protein